MLIALVTLLPISAVAQDNVSYTLSDGRTVQPLETFRECDVCPEMIVMPLGSFMMGAIPGESRNPFDFYGDGATGRVRAPDEINIIPSEHPRHRVQIDIPFAIGRNEVTHAEWMACVEGGGCTHNPDHTLFVFRRGGVALGPMHPVIDVSYWDIQEYVTWLNTQIGADVYRLPTEAEWEYAARAGTETRFAQGDELSADQANFSRAATEHVRQTIQQEPMTHLTNRRMPVRVDELDASNAWGLRHMSGNVREWTQSCSTEAHVGLATASAYLQLAQSQTTCRRTAKGGAFTTAMDGVRLASSTQPKESRRDYNLGFRIVRDLTQQ
ncbi:formylglycine-generating enzyme family protein [Pseudaestuariivita rosea]|uniref:formylglycine-generating enzyme family protein n=1 Tax=Pseudaestuariivita rosea TaxID=2763263 RepID=UPI001ABA6D16